MKSASVSNLDQFLQEDDGNPVVMLNLLRFRQNVGRELYFEYLSKAGPIAASYGAEIVFSGEGRSAIAAEPGQAWDAVVLVRYPARQAFISMIADPRYVEIDAIRISALEEAVLQPLS